jgi:nitroimidazol reductase NimA-like FMN-containing flavoprotein (pyridoxamine 5'-phosphate oxidase superfamily)
MTTTPLSTDELAPAECWRLLRASSVGRIAFVDERTGIEVFPVNFLVDHGTIVFRTAVGTKLTGVAGSPQVVFEADGHDAATGAPWTVVARGRAEPIDARRDVIETFDIELATWHAAAKPYFVRVVPVTVEGRRVRTD